MPPKKNLESKTPVSAKKPQEKLAKPRVKQLKLIQNPPIVAELIPDNINNMTPKAAVVKNTTPKLTRKQKAIKKKVDMANEVAAAQLGIKQYTELETAPILTVPPKPMRRRRKNTQEPTEAISSSELCASTNESVIATDSEVAAAQLGNKQHTTLETATIVTVPPKPKRGKRKNTQEPTEATESAIATDSEEAFDLTPKKRSWGRRRAAAKKPEAVNATKGDKPSFSLKQTKLTDAKSGITKTPTSIIKSEYNIRKRKPRTETGKTIADTSTEAPLSPSIFEQIEPKKEKTDTPTPISDQNVEPCFIESRKTSLTSECLSWTKDISSSSTTTCVTVCSTDIVRIDKKMPMIKLTPTTCHRNQDLNSATPDIESSSSDSDSSVSEHSRNPRSDKEFTPELESHSLNLSTSSISLPNSPRPVSSLSANSCQNIVVNEEMNRIANCINKLASKLKHFDLEIINWIGYENEEVDADTNKIHDNIFKMLKEESEVITHCRHLRQLLSGNVTEDEANEESTEPVAKERNMKQIEDDNDNARSPMRVTSEITEDENNFTSDRDRDIPFDQNCDDDDALSLFAESITGMESSRRNSSAAGDFEEYVPQPLNKEKWEPTKKISYTPSCIKQIDVKAKPVCEKQNADSTSIYKESEQYKDNSEPFKKIIPPLLGLNTDTNKKKLHLMSYVFKPITGLRSQVFRGICFYNILSSCKNINCRFPHVIPKYNEITAKLAKLSEEMFIQEYMILRNWPILRRKYGMCFVQECIKRDLTRILVEMALDFVIKANETYRDDSILKVTVIECVLLHLNSVDLEICEDILMYKHHNELLCEIFMQVISNTQNFSRFKPVFINLTRFILRQTRTFSLDVATQILERVCILPCELPLLETLLEIVKNTDQAILMNSMMGHFENQLSVASKELYDTLLKLKKEASMNRPVLQHLYQSSPMAVPEQEPVVANSLVNDREKRYTSPDTTNLDSMNKSTDEPTIHRTIDTSRAQLSGCTIQKLNNNCNSNSSSDSTEEFRPKIVPRPNFKYWKDRSILSNIPGLSPSPVQWHGTPRPLTKRHMHQNLKFGPGSTKFPRRSGPDFF